METFQPLYSSHIERADYDAGQTNLRVTFKDGSEYEYRGVPVTVWQGFQNSRSAGEYFQRQIRGRFPSAEV